MFYHKVFLYDKKVEISILKVNKMSIKLSEKEKSQIYISPYENSMKKEKNILIKNRTMSNNHKSFISKNENTITKISQNAFAVMAVCEETKKPFGITVDPVKNNLLFVWAFKIDKEKAHREGFDQRNVNGSIIYDANFPGCPHCGAKQLYVCDNCKALVCYHGEKHIVCPSCGMHGEIRMVKSVKLRGGGY